MSTTETTTAQDGTGLLLRSWPSTGAPRAAIVIVHGLGEHSGRYEHIGRQLTASGFAVVAVDLRGFGGSEGKRAYVRRFDNYLDDTQVAVDKAATLNIPVVLLGHSMGGLIALRYRQVRDGADFLVLSAPALDARIPTAKRLAAQVLRRILPGVSLPNGITAEQLSRDPSVGEAYFTDPLVHTRTTAGLGGALLDAMALATSGAVPVPTLVIHGEADPLVPPELSEPLAAHFGVDRVTFPEFRHESFNEEGGSEAVSVVTSWINRRLTQASP